MKKNVFFATADKNRRMTTYGKTTASSISGWEAVMLPVLQVEPETIDAQRK